MLVILINSIARNKLKLELGFNLIGRHMTSHLRSGKSLNISGDQTGRFKHRSGEHMIQPYIVRCGIYGERLQLSLD